MEWRDPRVRKLYEDAALLLNKNVGDIPCLLLGRRVGQDMSYRRLNRTDSLPSNILEYTELLAVVPVGAVHQFTVA